MGQSPSNTSSAAQDRELDPSQPVEALAHLIKAAADLQVRLCTWRVRDEADFRSLDGDLRALAAEVEDVQARVRYERNRMGV